MAGVRTLRPRVEGDKMHMYSVAVPLDLLEAIMDACWPLKLTEKLGSPLGYAKSEQTGKEGTV